MELPFTGRKKESFTLNRIINKAFDDKIQTTIYLDGEAGIGKSRFIDEFVKSNDYKALFIYGDEKKSSWQPLISFLKTYFQTSSNPNKTKSNFQSVFNEISRDLSGNVLKKELNHYKSIFSGFIGIKSADSFFAKLEPRAQYENLLKALYALLSAEFVKQPFVLIVEDAHWLDLETVKFLTSLKNSTIPLIISSRYLENNAENNIPGLAGKRVKLLPLSQKSCKEILKRSLKKDSFKDQSDSYLKKSSGNPLILKSFIEANFQASENLDLAAAITKKLNSLTLERKKILDSAMALGNHPDKEIMTVLHPDQKLEQPGFLVRSPQGLTFEHALIKDNLYYTQNKDKLGAIHLQVAKTIESHYSAQLDSHYCDLAEHYEKAYNFSDLQDQTAKESMLAHLNNAVNYASKRFDNHAVVKFSDKLAEHIDQEKQTEIYFNALDKKALACKFTGRWQEAKGIYEEALRLAEKKNLYQYILHFKKYQAGVVFLTQGPEASKVAYQEVLDIAIKYNNQEFIADMQHDLGNSYYQTGEIEKASDMLNKSLQTALSINYKAAELRALDTISNIMIDNDEYDIPLQRKLASLAYGKENNIGQLEAMSLADIGLIYNQTGDNTKALHYYNLALEKASQIGNRQIVFQVTNNLGVLYETSWIPTKALEYFHKSLAMSLAVGDTTTAAIIQANIGSVLLQINKDAEAIISINKAIVGLKNNVMNYYLCSAYHTKALLLYKKKHYSQALTMLKQALKLTEETNRESTNLDCKILIAEINFLATKSTFEKMKYFRELETFLKNESDPDRSTNLYYTLFTLSKQVKADSKYQKEIALEKFKELYKQQPTKSVKNIINKLSR